MQVMGASASDIEAVTDAVAAAGASHRAALLWSDGHDVVAVIADDGESADDVRQAARRFVPEVAA